MRASTAIRHPSEGLGLMQSRTDLAAQDLSLRWVDGLREPS